MDWYEELDYEENPFKDNEDTELIGYENVIDEVLYRIESGCMVCVEGKSGAGKTAVLKSVLNKFGGNGSGRVIYLNGQQLSNGLNIEKMLNKKAGLFKRLFGKKPKNMILLLDEVQNLSEKNCERIKYYFDNSFVKSVVFTSSNFKNANFTESLKERISKTVKLKDLTEDEAVDIIRSRLGNDELIPEEMIKEVFNRSNRNMKSFLKNCDKLCAFSFENNGKKVLQEHVSKVFGQPETVEGHFEMEVEEPERRVNKKVTVKSPKKKPDKAKDNVKSAKKETNDDPRMAVEEPVTVTIVDDFKPEKKEVKMELKEQCEEVDIDSELKKFKKNKQEDDDDLDIGDYEGVEEPEEEDDEKSKPRYEDEDIAEKYY